MSPENQVAQLGKYGLVGVMLALVIALIILSGINYKMSSDFTQTTATINNNVVAAIKENTAALSRLTTMIEARK